MRRNNETPAFGDATGLISKSMANLPSILHAALQKKAGQNDLSNNFQAIKAEAERLAPSKKSMVTERNIAFVRAWRAANNPLPQPLKIFTATTSAPGAAIVMVVIAKPSPPPSKKSM